MWWKNGCSNCQKWFKSVLYLLINDGLGSGCKKVDSCWPFILKDRCNACDKLQYNVNHAEVVISFLSRLCPRMLFKEHLDWTVRQHYWIHARYMSVAFWFLKLVTHQPLTIPHFTTNTSMGMDVWYLRMHPMNQKYNIVTFKKQKSCVNITQHQLDCNDLMTIRSL